MNEDDRTKMAIVRLGVLGPLISARLEHGDKTKLFEEAASRIYEGPDGQEITVKGGWTSWRQGCDWTPGQAEQSPQRSVI